MSILFNSISIFRDSLEGLCKKPKYGYHSCPDDVCEALKTYTFEEIWEMNFCVRDMDNIRVIKIRIPNSNQNLSSADGFRLIVCCNKNYKSVSFLNVYPKRGKLAQLDQPKEEYKRQLKMYLDDLKNKALIEHNINRSLTIVKK